MAAREGPVISKTIILKREWGGGRGEFKEGQESKILASHTLSFPLF